VTILQLRVTEHRRKFGGAGKAGSAAGGDQCGYAGRVRGIVQKSGIYVHVFVRPESGSDPEIRFVACRGGVNGHDIARPGEFLIDSGGTVRWVNLTGDAFRNQTDESFEWLDRAYAQRDPSLMSTKVEPLLKSLHNDPRYAAFLKKLNLPN
jgi:hypothetical protein